MTFVKYQNTNNASSLLIADISASATTMLITDGDQSLFPSNFPFLLTLEHLNSEGDVVLREIVKATANNQNSFTIVRGAGTCVQDDTASNRSQDNTAHAFYSGDRVSLYRTAEQTKDIQDRLETSANDTAIADEYDSTQTYEVGDIVMYKGDRYTCSTDVSSPEAFDGTKRTKLSVQYDIEDMQEDIRELQQKNTASNHLEETGIVGELYTLSDKLFKQSTPTLANSTVDCNVGDIASNTEIHIQRIGSGVASSELKLKVKSVGSPTTGLVVEVRKGVEVDVSTSEAYWYGDEVIASGSIGHSSISNSYAEFTVSLNENFGGTEGELLDVVVYQTGSIVNASNYYVIACDSTQYSEAFSYVSVDGNTRTRSQYMPYCVSSGFAQSLLCKTNDFSVRTLVASGNYSGSSSETAVYTETLSMSAQFELSGSLRATSGFSCYVLSKINGTQDFYDSTGTTAKDISNTSALLSAGTTYGVYIRNNGSGGGGVALNNTTIYRIQMRKRGKTSPALTPYNIQGLGEKIGCFLYGMFEGTYKGGLMIEKTSTATAGSITLGNAEGYIKVDLNGEIVKIPYYNE